MVVFGWAYLAPVQLGGATSYVVTEGVSMLPKFEAGGLVITRTADTYAVGDVVAYRSGSMDGAVVLHRIVGTHGEQFVMQGDNNDYRDTFEPASKDIVGKMWLHAPGAGGYVAILRDPLGFAVVIGLIAIVSLRVAPRSRRRRHHHVS